MDSTRKELERVLDKLSDISIYKVTIYARVLFKLEKEAKAGA